MLKPSLLELLIFFICSPLIALLSEFSWRHKVLKVLVVYEFSMLINDGYRDDLITAIDLLQYNSHYSASWSVRNDRIDVIFISFRLCASPRQSSILHLMLSEFLAWERPSHDKISIAFLTLFDEVLLSTLLELFPYLSGYLWDENVL